MGRDIRKLFVEDNVLAVRSELSRTGVVVELESWSS
jgi:hypothetical protein